MRCTSHEQTSKEALQQLVDELGQSPIPITIEVVGGAAIVLHGDRGILTNDVDVMFANEATVRPAIHRVATARSWPEDWANDAVLLFASHFDQPSDWEERFTSGTARIMVARPPLLLAMKLLSGRGLRDLDDIALLLGICGVISFDQAIEIFEHYYPTEVPARKAVQQLRRHFDTSANEPH